MQWRHISTESAVTPEFNYCYYLPTECYWFFLCYHKPWMAWDILFVMSSVTGNPCNKCPKLLIKQNSSYSDYFNATSGFTSNSRGPGGPVTLALTYSPKSHLRIQPHWASASTFTFVMAHIDIHLYNRHQASCPFSSIDTGVNADTEAGVNARCG